MRVKSYLGLDVKARGIVNRGAIQSEIFMTQTAKSPFEPFFEEIRVIVREEIAVLNGNKSPTELLTPEELAERLKVPVTWIYEQSRQGNIPTHRIGRYIRFDFHEVLDSQKKG